MEVVLKLVAMLLSMKVGVATNFSFENDPWNPNPNAACLHRDLRATDVGVAHPTLPCKSRVLIFVPRTGRSVVASVVDRGPRAALVDLAPATTKKLRANGWEYVILIPERK